MSPSGQAANPSEGHTALGPRNGWMDGWRGRQRQNKSNDTLRRERTRTGPRRRGRDGRENAEENQRIQAIFSLLSVSFQLLRQTGMGLRYDMITLNRRCGLVSSACMLSLLRCYFNPASCWLAPGFLSPFVQTDGGIGQDGPPNGDYDHHDCKKLLACFLLSPLCRRRCP